jgi:two-component system response regulator MprA
MRGWVDLDAAGELADRVQELARDSSDRSIGSQGDPPRAAVAVLHERLVGSQIEPRHERARAVWRGQRKRLPAACAQTQRCVLQLGLRGRDRHRQLAQNLRVRVQRVARRAPAIVGGQRRPAAGHGRRVAAAATGRPMRIQLSFTFARQHPHMRLLVVDDDPSVREALALVLDLNGFDVTTAGDGREAIRTLSVAAPDAVILDVLMPGLDGLEVCRRIRATGDRTPVLMLTARTEVSERVAGLEAGADDYLAKPFAREELIARLRALLRRTGWEGDDRGLRFEDLALDPLAHEARRDGRLLELTRTEFLLLELLMRHPRQVLTRGAIFDHVWGYDFGPASNSLEVYIGYLRRKTEAGGEPRLVHTVRGVGYVLRQPR